VKRGVDSNNSRKCDERASKKPRVETFEMNSSRTASDRAQHLPAPPKDANQIAMSLSEMMTQELFNLINDASKAKDQRALSTYVQKISVYIDDQPASLLLEKGPFNQTWLSDVLYFPFKMQKDKHFASVISQKLFFLLISKMEKCNGPQKLDSMLR
jgi:hypothetical protein